MNFYGGTISGNTVTNGHGEGIYMKGENFDMHPASDLAIVDRIYFAYGSCIDVYSSLARLSNKLTVDCSELKAYDKMFISATGGYLFDDEDMAMIITNPKYGLDIEAQGEIIVHT